MKTPSIPILFILCLLAPLSEAATVFLTNNTSAKTLASNEGDAGVGLTAGGVDNGNNNGLHGDATGDSTVLNLSQDDGGGAITFNTVSVSNNKSLFMNTTSMGHENDKWGSNQNWTFTLNQAISFDALDFAVDGGDSGKYILRSAAWKDDAAATGTGWSFTSDGVFGTFFLLNGQIRDFTSSGVSNVAAGTEIAFGAFGSAGGGDVLRSFTITPVAIPEPSAMVVVLVGVLLQLRRRRD